MFSVGKRVTLSPHTFLWEITAPDLANAAHPGQFVMVRLREAGERIPLTIADFDRRRGTITLVVKVIGKTTTEMATFSEGQEFLDLGGPYGSPTKIPACGHVVLVGGGLGVAPLYPILRAIHEAGIRTTTIIGFRNRAEIFWEERFRELGAHCLIMTEDGSSGRTGNVAYGLKQLLLDDGPIDEVLTIGPLNMMQAVAELTRPYKIPTYASMNPIMVDGIGMCGSCRVKVGDQVLFACVDGPDMDAHKIDFEELKIRQRRFLLEEQNALTRYRERCALT